MGTISIPLKLSSGVVLKVTSFAVPRISTEPLYKIPIPKMLGSNPANS